MTFNVFALGAEILPSNPRDSDDLLCRSTLPTNTQTDFNFRWFRNGQEISFPVREILGTEMIGATADNPTISPRGITVGEDGLDRKSVV